MITYLTLVYNTVVSKNNIDWVDTIALNVHPGLGDMEKEIRLFKNTSIKIESIEFTKGEKELDPLIFDKTYYA